MIASTNDVALPAGADPNMVDEWQIDNTGEHPTYRCVWSTPFYPEPMLRVVAVQLATGDMFLEEGDKPAVYMDHTPMSPADARALAAALTAAADLADSWINAECTTCEQWDSCPRHPKAVTR